MKKVVLVMLAVLSAGLVGCSPPQASLSLIAQGRRALQGAADREAAQSALLLEQIDQQQTALDVAFDADVRLCASGSIKDAEGNPIAFDADWVISARKGYTAAVGVLQKNRANVTTASATALDNIKAGDEALEMAATLIIMQQNVSANIKQWLLSYMNKESQ